jgi:sulfonate transport system substrate-binding protein
MKHKKNWLLLGLSILVIAAIFYGWSQTNESSSSNLKTVIVGYQPGSAWDVIKSRGKFVKKMEKQGYKIKFKEFQNGAAMLEALATGDVDYAPVGDTPPISALASGTKLTYVAAGNTQAKNSEVLVKKNSGINSLKDLKGKKIAYTKGTSSQYMVFRTLKKAGLSVDDVKWVNLDQNAAAVAYSKGKVDAWATWDPMAAKAELSDSSKVLTNGEATGAVNRSFIASPSNYAKNHRSVSKLLIKYGQQEMVWINHHHTKVIDILSDVLSVPKKAIKLTVERQTYGLYKMKKSYVTKEQKIADTFYEENILSKHVDISKHVQYLN